MAEFFVVGSAHLDIICEAVEFKDTLDKPGIMCIEFGGTAANVAVNLAAQGATVDFATATNASAISNVILHEMKKPGIRVLSETNDQLPESGFSAHLKDGDMQSAIASMAVQYHRFAIDETMRTAITSASWLVVDCNLSIESLQDFIKIGRSAGLNVAILMVSEGKGLKVTSLPPADYYFCNNREYLFLQTHSRRWQPDDSSVFVVTNGALGANAFKGMMKCNHTPAGEVSHPRNFMGAGDAYAAGVLFSLASGYSLDDSMAAGSLLACKVLSNGHSHLGSGNSLNRQIQHLSNHAYHDSLTKLFNRAGADLILSRFRDLGVGFSVLMFDIDHFKAINDTFGHKVGDDALVHISKLIKRSIGDNDFAFRFGGEEFVVISPVNVGLARSMAERIRKHIEKYGKIGPVKKLTVSIGVAYASCSDLFDVALQSADEALYVAKNDGRNCVRLGKDGKNCVRLGEAEN